MPPGVAAGQMVLTALIFSVGAVMGADYTVTVLPPTPDTPPKTSVVIRPLADARGSVASGCANTYDAMLVHALGLAQAPANDHLHQQVVGAARDAHAHPKVELPLRRHIQIYGRHDLLLLLV